MKFFSIDSPLYKFMQRLWDIVKLNFMWILFSLPIVTAGVSTVAAFYVALRMSDDTEGDIIHNFTSAFKVNLKQGIAMTFISLICVTAVWLDFAIYNMTEENSLPFLIIGILSAYFLTFSLIYVYPLIARYDNTVFNSLRNSFRLGMKFFIRTIVLIFIVAFEAAVFLWNTKTLFLGAVIGPASIIYTISAAALRIFKEIEKIPGSTVPNNDKTEETDHSE